MLNYYYYIALTTREEDEKVQIRAVQSRFAADFPARIFFTFARPASSPQKANSNYGRGGWVET